MTDAHTIEAEIRRYLDETSESGIDGIDGIENDTDLLASGLVDSFAVLELVNFVEVTYDVLIPDEEFELDRFQSIDAVIALVLRMIDLELESHDRR
jgi:acyl carrier protein